MFWYQCCLFHTPPLLSATDNDLGWIATKKNKTVLAVLKESQWKEHYMGAWQASGPSGQLLLMSPGLELLKVSIHHNHWGTCQMQAPGSHPLLRNQFLDQDPAISIVHTPSSPAPSATYDENHTWKNTALWSIPAWSEHIKQNQQHPSASQVHIHTKYETQPLSLKGLQSNWEMKDTLCEEVN